MILQTIKDNGKRLEYEKLIQKENLSLRQLQEIVKKDKIQLPSNEPANPEIIINSLLVGSEKGLSYSKKNHMKVRLSCGFLAFLGFNFLCLWFFSLVFICFVCFFFCFYFCHVLFKGILTLFFPVFLIVVPVMVFCFFRLAFIFILFDKALH